MSLKNVHLLFIVASVMLSLFVVRWSVAEFVATRTAAPLAAVVLAAAAAVGMSWYGLNFNRRCRRLGVR